MRRAAFPVDAALRIEVRRDQPVIGRDIGLVIGCTEEAIEDLPRRQPVGSDKLQAIERHVRAAEIDGSDAGGIAGQVGQHVAAARRDRHNMAVGF